MSIGYIYPEKLTLQRAAELAPRVRQADRDDLKTQGEGPDHALVLAMALPGEAWAVMWQAGGEEAQVIGAGGWTEEGVIWTLWADLSLGQARAVMRMVVPYARIMSIRAQRPLSNFYAMRNNATEKFLKATRCIDFTGDVRYFSGRYWNHFTLKPLKDMPDV